MVETLDLDFIRPRTIASYLVTTSAGPVLVETGPESVYDNLKKALAERGLEPADLAAVFVTHIHLDHSGAAWRLVEDGAPAIYVHPKGAPHLIDPSRLWESASRIYRDKMEELWGRPGAIPKDRVIAVEHGRRIKVGEREFWAIETPGHAGHHHAWFVDGVLFSGDVGGVRIGKGPVVPPFPPPEINLEAWADSILKMRALEPLEIRPTHFGAFSDVDAHLDELEERMYRWAEKVLDWMRAGMDEEEMVAGFAAMEEAELKARELDEGEREEYEIADPAWMSIPGLTRYWSKFHPEFLND
jgi:glyoxylase-like metal-dependent hydrolase (beta-lactamase superfamily II)